MGDHRALIKIEFEMHGVKTTSSEMWINWWRGAAPHDLPSAVTEFFSRAEQASMSAYDDAEYKIARASAAKQREVADRAMAKLTPEEVEAIRCTN